MEFLLSIAAIVTGSSIVAGYIWSTRCHFYSETVSFGATVIALGVIATLIWYSALLLMFDQPVGILAVGLAIQMTSGALFWWAISATRKARLRYVFDPNEPHGLVKGGPYRYVRHPFYASYIMLWAGWALATDVMAAFFPVGLFALIYSRAAHGEEASFLQSSMAWRYRAYMESTGFLLPRLSARRLPAREQS